MKHIIAILCLAFATSAYADGESCGLTDLGTGEAGGVQWGCVKLCAGKNTTGALTCGPILVPNQDADDNHIFVQTTGGCGYDSIVVGELISTETSGVEVKALGVIDDDLAAITGITGVSEIIVPFPLMRYVYVSSGVLAGCSTATFEIWLAQHKR